MKKLYDFILLTLGLLFVMYAICITTDYTKSIFQYSTWSIQELFCLIILIPTLIGIMIYQNRKGEGDEKR